MHPSIHYETVSEAINSLRQQGFTENFTISGNQFCCEQGNFDAGDFEIVDIYRYEGDTDPADEAAVYAIESRTGLKGVLVTGYGISSDTDVFHILNKLAVRNK